MGHVDIKRILEERGPTGKLEGNAPEGFVLVHEDTLEELKDFEFSSFDESIKSLYEWYYKNKNEIFKDSLS